MLRSLVSARASAAAFSRSNIWNGILVRFEPQRASISIIAPSLAIRSRQGAAHERLEIVEDPPGTRDVVDQIELQAEALKGDLQQRGQPVGRDPELVGEWTQRR